MAVGQHHTLDVEPNRAISIWKGQKWDTVAQMALDEAMRGTTTDAVAAVVMQSGLANIAVVLPHRTLLKSRIESPVPKKLSAAKEQDTGMKKFLQKTLDTLSRDIPLHENRRLLLAGPGFVAQNFRDFLADTARETNNKALAKVAAGAVVVHTSSGHLHALNEALMSPSAAKIMRDLDASKLMDDMTAVERVTAAIRRDNGRAWYGEAPVAKAVAEGAVGVGGGLLLINNDLFRSQDMDVRKKFVAIVDRVKAAGGEVRVLSSDHESGAKLRPLGGIAALLTYPMLDLMDDEEDAGESGGPANQTAAEPRPRPEEDDVDFDAFM